ncbi:MAG: HINT domain-containing protein [Clostridiales bacterium]|nr:HINT domain-containing protein [Clostridiales bacterium]
MDEKASSGLRYIENFPDLTPVKGDVGKVSAAKKDGGSLLTASGGGKTVNGASFAFDAFSSDVKELVKSGINNLLHRFACVVSGRGCFAGGTLVYTPSGYVPIELIKSGDLVCAKDPDSGEFGVKKVLETSSSGVYAIYYVTIGDEKIGVTDEHPFWVYGKGFVKTEDLNVGDEVVSHNRENLEEDFFGIQIVNGIEKIYFEDKISVHNLIVEDWHTYYIGRGRVFAHNGFEKCAKTDDPAKKGTAAKDETSAGETRDDKTYRDLDDYINQTYPKKNTVAIVAQCPVENSRVAVDFASGDVGHTFVRIGYDDGSVIYKGFYPAKALSVEEILKKVDVDGMISDDSAHDWNAAVVCEIDKEKADEIADFMNNYNEKYNMVSNNCSTVAVKAFKLAGTGSPTSEHKWTLPENSREMIISGLPEGSKFKGLKATIALSGLNGYTPADAVEDFKARPVCVTKSGGLVKEKR